jgi:PAS domain S-box-containing protein
VIDGTADSLFLSPAAALASLAFALAALSGFRLLRLAQLCEYGRLGRAAAGLVLGLLLALGLGFAWLNQVPLVQQATAEELAAGWLPWFLASQFVAPNLLALTAAVRHDSWLATASLPVALTLPVLAGLPGIVFAAAGILAAFLLPLLWRRLPVTGATRGLAVTGLVLGLTLIPMALVQALPGLFFTLLAVAFYPAALLGMVKLLGEPADHRARRMSGITANGGAIEELKAAPLISRTIADLPEGVAVFDAADRLVACNATYRRHNADIADLLEIGARYADLVRAGVMRGAGRPAAAGEDPEAAIAAHLARHRQLPWRVEVPTPDGGTLLVIESKTADGGTLRLMTDVTAIKGREMRLSELAQRNDVLATAVGSVSSGIVICDATRADHPVTFANAAFTRITGYATEEIIGRNCRILQGRDTDADALDKLRRALAQQRSVHVTLRNYRKDGRTFWNELAISPVTDNTGRVVQFVGIMSDVTQRIRGEESLREAKNQAEFANRSKSEFLANVSHELRTPLNAIIGFSDVMKMELLGPLGTPRYQDYAKDILDSGKLLLSLIEDILDLSKIESGKMELHPEPVMVEDVFDLAMTLMRERAKNGGVTLRSEVEPNLPPLLVDPRAMKQMVVNLASNAVKFTPRDGEVHLVARRLGPDRAEIVVSDTGIGIAKKDLGEVVKPFVQVDSAHQRRQSGTGLGLPIVKSLADLSGGSFHLDSELGKGTMVTLQLPLADSDQARSAAE